MDLQPLEAISMSGRRSCKRQWSSHLRKVHENVPERPVWNLIKKGIGHARRTKLDKSRDLSTRPRPLSKRSFVRLQSLLFLWYGLQCRISGKSEVRCCVERPNSRVYYVISRLRSHEAGIVAP